jgi:hypothetical protein
MILGRWYQTSVSRKRALVRNTGVMNRTGSRGAPCRRCQRSADGLCAGSSWRRLRPCGAVVSGRRNAGCCESAGTTTTGNDTGTMTSSSSNPPSSLIGGWQRRRRSKPADYKLERTSAGTTGTRALAARSSVRARRKNPDNRSSGLNLSNAPNPLPRGSLQQALGGEHHETCFCTCWSRRA